MVSINDSLRRITQGNLEEQASADGSTEMIQISEGINATVASLKDYMRRTQEQVEKDLRFATQIQLSTLPSAPLNVDAVDMGVAMFAAKHVGGDFYDYYMYNDDTLVFLSADVSGKSIPGAMFMMRAKAQVKAMVEAGHPVEEAISLASNDLCVDNEANMFVTLWMGYLTLSTGQIKYVNAGHNPPLIRKADGQFEYIRTKTNLVMAAFEDAPYRAQELQLNPGDMLVLYTDGVTEQINGSTEQFGERRLQDYLNSLPSDVNPTALCTGIYDTVMEFAGGADQFDDISAVALRFKG